jgi:hypothetical protein
MDNRPQDSGDSKFKDNRDTGGQPASNTNNIENDNEKKKIKELMVKEDF